MSRIGNQPILIPSDVHVVVEEFAVLVKGPKGELKTPLFENILVNVEGDRVFVKCEDNAKTVRAKHGLVRALLANCVTGTYQGFSKTLLLQGVGYRANRKGNQIILSLGFSHDVSFDEPKDVQVEVKESTKLIVSGIDKQRVGEVSAQIRSFRPPEPYKGKGVRYEDEKVRRKSGKAGKK